MSVRGPGAYSLASEARYGLEAAERFFDLWRVLGFAGCGPVTDLSVPLGGRIQQRAFFDITFYALFGRAYPLEWFDASQWAINNESLQLPKEEAPCL